MERLQKIIAESGYCSRRKAEELILEGKVVLNGEVVRTLGTKANSSDDILVNGVRLSKEGKEYYLLNKPRGYVSTTSDEKNRPNICELIDTQARIYPVGRLDYDTTGLILLTNDGELANMLMHPKFEIEKTYIAKIEGELSMEAFHKLKSGIIIEKIKCTPTKVKIRKKDKDSTLVEITIVEGRNHIIKKIFSSVGYEVIRLSRIRYAFLDLGKLKSGEYRILNPKEVKRLYNLKNE